MFPYYYVGKKLSAEERRRIFNIFEDTEVKARITKEIRTEVDRQLARRNGYSKPMSYDALTSGDVNMQARMAASGYDTYGKVYLKSNNATKTNESSYRKMKNKIKYGKSPQRGYENRGDFTIE